MEFGLFGLHEDEEVVYRELPTAPRVRKRQLADRLGWPEHRVSATLEQLARRSLVRPSVEQPGEHRLVKPEVRSGHGG
jgi:sugar-specific transcriptional regulator TrmB